MSDFNPLNISILTISDSRVINDDESGKYLVESIMKDNHSLVDYQICRDDIYKIRAKISVWVADIDTNVIITTGGTGVTGRDITPEAICPLFDKEITGFGEVFRYLSFKEIGISTVQSRAFAGLANKKYIFSLPGSLGACKTAWTKILKYQLDNQYKPCNFSELIARLYE